MVTNSADRLAVAVQALVELAEAERGMATSAELAIAVDAHPVGLRRLLGLLRWEGIVESRSGPKGGWAIARDPERITLGMVHRAIRGDAAIVSPMALDEALALAEEAFTDQLGRVTLADILAGRPIRNTKSYK